MANNLTICGVRENWLYISKIRDDVNIYSYLEEISKEVNDITIYRSLGSVDYSDWSIKKYFVERQVDMGNVIGKIVNKSVMMLFLKKQKVDEGEEEGEDEKNEKIKKKTVAAFVVSTDKKIQKIIRKYVDTKLLDTKFFFDVVRYNYNEDNKFLNEVTCVKTIPLVGNLSFQSKKFSPPIKISELAFDLFGSYCKELRFSYSEQQYCVSRFFVARRLTILDSKEKITDYLNELLEKIGKLYNKNNGFNSCQRVPFWGDIKEIENKNLVEGLEKAKGLKKDKIVKVVREEESRAYFKINGLWLKLSVGFFKVLQTRFREVVEEIKKDPKEVELIHTTWESSKNEVDYNKKYLKNDRFILGDNVKSGQIFELFDFLKMYKKKNILYHVKVKFDNDIRVVCSQIYNSAKTITSLRITKNDSVGCLYRSESEKDTKMFEKYIDMENKRFGLWSEIVNKNCTDFYSFMKKKFEFVLVCLREDSNQFDVSTIGSSIAKISLVKLKTEMDELGVPLKLCVIPASDKKD